MKQCFLQGKLLTFASLLHMFMAIAASAQGFSPETEAKLQTVLNQFQQQYGIGGMSAAINVDGLAKWKGATGYAYNFVDQHNNVLPGGIPFTENSLSRIFSITKTFTAALTLELVKEGYLKLSDPVSKFLTPNEFNQLLNSSATIHQLLAHETGYSDIVSERDLQIAIAVNPGVVWAPLTAVLFTHQLFEPGTKRQYSSTNYIVLGAIIERATGKSIANHFRERFFNPLDFTSFFLMIQEPLDGYPEALAGPHDNISSFNPIFESMGRPTYPDAYTNIQEFLFTAIESIAFTSGGLVANAEEVAEWGNALFGGRATSNFTLDLMLNSIATTPDEDGDYLGYGIFRTTKISNTDVFIGHDGNALGYRSLMFYQPDRKMTITVLSNFAGANPYEIAAALYNAIPNFIGGNDNRKEAKIVMCWNGKMHTVARPAAKGFINKGAYLGACEPAIATKGRNKSMAMSKQPADVMEMIVYPNPSGGTFHFQIMAQESGNASLRIYDISGKLIGVPFNGTMQKGEQRTVTYDGGKLSNGTYFSQLQTASGMTRQKLVVNK